MISIVDMFAENRDMVAHADSAKPLVTDIGVLDIARIGIEQRLKNWLYRTVVGRRRSRRGPGSAADQAADD